MPTPETITKPVNPLDALTKEQRKAYFFTKKDKESLALLESLCAEVESIKDATKKREFFLNHPELEVRYSAVNFK